MTIARTTPAVLRPFVVALEGKRIASASANDRTALGRYLPSAQSDLEKITEALDLSSGCPFCRRLNGPGVGRHVARDHSDRQLEYRIVVTARRILQNRASATAYALAQRNRRHARRAR